MRKERTLLGDVADSTFVRRDVHAARVGDDGPAHRDRARSAAMKPMIRRSSVVLPLPEAPRIAVIVPSGNDEVDVGEHGTGPVRLGQAFTAQFRHGQASPSARTLPKRLIST